MQACPPALRTVKMAWSPDFGEASLITIEREIAHSRSLHTPDAKTPDTPVPAG